MINSLCFPQTATNRTAITIKTMRCGSILSMAKAAVWCDVGDASAVSGPPPSQVTPSPGWKAEITIASPHGQASARENE